MMEENKSELRKLAEFIHDLTWEQMPAAVQRAVPERVLDLVSVSVGATEDRLIRQIAAFYETQGKTGNCHVWGYEKTYALSAAALLNGMLAHTLELDDVHSTSKTHGSASLIPAAWACAEYLDKSGNDFLTAVAAGYETVARVGMALGVSSHRNRGWHATSTCGVFGCAAACAKLLELDTEGIISALGMAGTQSCGVWAFLEDGSSCKALHTGRAAANGLEAAFLAQAGMTGPEHILEGRDGGLLLAMSDAGDASKISAGLGTTWEILRMDMKPYPCCRSTHCAIDCALALRKQLNVNQIEKITVSTYLVGYKQCAVSEGCRKPQCALEAKFSTPYCVAAALLYGRVSMKEFEPQIVQDQRVQSLLSKVTVVPEARFTTQYPGHWGCGMKLEMRDGSTFRYEVSDPSGSMANPLTGEQAVNKAKSFLHTAYAGREQEIVDRILGLAGERSISNIFA